MTKAKDNTHMLQDYVEFDDGSCAVIQPDGTAHFSDGTPPCKVRIENGRLVLLKNLKGGAE